MMATTAANSTVQLAPDREMLKRLCQETLCRIETALPSLDTRQQRLAAESLREKLIAEDHRHTAKLASLTAFYDRQLKERERKHLKKLRERDDLLSMSMEEVNKDRLLYGNENDPEWEELWAEEEAEIQEHHNEAILAMRVAHDKLVDFFESDRRIKLNFENEQRHNQLVEAVDELERIQIGILPVTFGRGASDNEGASSDHGDQVTHSTCDSTELSSSHCECHGWESLDDCEDFVPAEHNGFLLENVPGYYDHALNYEHFD